jgi:hypothetical protein
MKIIPIEPFWKKLREYHNQFHTDEEFWDWLKREYNAYGVYIVSNPTQVGVEKGCGLLFGTEEEVTFFILKWS